MPILNCSAVNCIYNKNELCSKGEISVEGQVATNPDQTSCASFQERGSASVSNTMGSPMEKVEVDCKACECTYNNNCKCEAAQIDIAGANASHCQDTKCGTFQCK